MRIVVALIALGVGGLVAAQNVLGPALGAWILAERNAAVESGVDRIPADIREVLTGYVADDILDAVRWRVDAHQTSLYPAFFEIGATPAVTLDYVVIFESGRHAADPALWAHELYHVGQYRDWGIDGFAERYLADYEAVERDAAEFRWQWMKKTGRVPAP